MIPLGLYGAARPVASGGGVSYARTSNTSATSATISNVPIGTASANRVVIVAMSYWSSSPRGITSATIGGVAATIDAQITGTRGGVVFRATVPTGTTADIATFNDGTIGTVSLDGTTSGMSVYVATDSVSVVDTAYQDVVASAMTATADTAAGGMLVAFASGLSHSSFTGLDDYTIESKNRSTGSAVTDGDPHTVTGNANGVLGLVTYKAA